ncbi:MAG: LytTR family transcriptional regulator [Bacteroidales bacterium]|nr:LytTR family transcriptional regulator [Bacteroidales bacterium]
MNIISYIKQPFPKTESKWRVIILISLFVALFLIVFQPFGINLFESNIKIIILSGYGLVTFIVLFINLILIENIFPKFFDERNWTIWKDFVWLIWVIFSIGLGNALYTYYIFDNLIFSIQGLIIFQFITFVVAVIPITVLIISKQKYLLTKHLNSANELNKNIDKTRIGINEDQTIRFFADNEKDSIEFKIRDFYFIESSGNYIELFFFDNDNIIRKTFRSTLKRSLEYFTDSLEIIQCHRAFIVNTNKIINAKGNSQGLRLNLENCELEVPVSRGFVNAVREKIN